MIAHFVMIGKSAEQLSGLGEQLEEFVLVWRPLNPNHAIERAKVTLIFSQDVPDLARSKAMASFDARRAELDFGAVSLIQGAMFSFQFGQAAPAGIQQAPGAVLGWQFARAAAPGLALEVVEMNGGQMSYESSEYSRWAFFIERLQKVWGDMPDFVGDIVSRKVTVLEYVDRFIYDGDPKQADVRQVLGDVADVIPELAASGDRLWHIHRGWFEDLSGEDVLVNVNLGTQDGILGQDGQVLRSLEGLTRVELRHRAGKDNISSLYADLEGLHQVANRTFARALSPEGRAMIGIEGQE